MLKRVAIIICMLLGSCIVWSQQHTTIIYEQNITKPVLGRTRFFTIFTSLSVYGDTMSVYRLSQLKKELYKPFDLNKSTVHHSTIHYKNSNINEDVAFLYDSLLLIQHAVNNLKWEISEKTKTICKELCYKATSGDSIIAWFAPRLNTFTAPSYYYGLPGIILELKDLRYNLTLDALKIIDSTQAIIPSKKILSVVSKEDYISFLQSKRKN